MTSDDEVRRKVATPPTLTTAQIDRLLRKHFPELVSSSLTHGVHDAGYLTSHSLDSYDDKNFLLHFVGRDERDEGTRMVLKLVNGVDSQNDGFLEAQIAALRHLRDCGVIAPLDYSPHVVKTDARGERLPHEEVGSPPYVVFAVRLLSYIPGKLLYDYHLEKANDHEARLELHRELGRNVAKLTRALSGFSHPATENRGLIWDLAHFETVAKDFFPYVVAASLSGELGREREAKLKRVLELYRRDFTKHCHGMRQQVIHNDLNDRNIVRLAFAQSPQRKYGFLDLGDMVRSYTVFEISICLAYVIVSRFATGVGTATWVDLARAVFASYDAELPLAEAELGAVYACVLARLATSISLGAYSLSRNPANREYLSIHAVPAWSATEALMGAGGREAFNNGVLGWGGTRGVML